jgi:hypothetical protein
LTAIPTCATVQPGLNLKERAMKRIGFLLLLGLAAVLIFNGCQKEAEATVTCSGCEMVIDRALAEESDGKWTCKACVAKAKAEETLEVALVECAGGCGMKMAKGEYKLVNDKPYCAGCVVQAAQPDQGESVVKKGEKPPPGAEAH